MKPVRLDGAVVAITGAGRGIGSAAAHAFAERGAQVFVGSRCIESARRAAAEIGGIGFAVDVRSRESFSMFLAAIGCPVDILVNNAGIMPIGSFLTADDAVTQATVDINPLGVIWGMKLVLPTRLESQLGYVINIASYLRKVPAPGAATYCASKFALVGLGEAVRDEITGSGVSVSTVPPTTVRTELIAGMKTGGLLHVVNPDRVAAACVRSCATRDPRPHLRHPRPHRPCRLRRAASATSLRPR